MRVRLKRNGWHKRLQIYTLGLKYLELPNLCPYFWLTILCLFIVPFIFVFKVGRGTVLKSIRGLEWFVEHAIFDTLDTYVFEPLLYNRACRMDGIDVYRAYKRRDKAWDKWFELNRDKADALIAKYKAEWEAWKKEQAEKEERKRQAHFAARKRREKLALQAANVMQKIFPVLAIIFLSILACCFFLLIKLLWHVAPMVPWLIVLKWAGYIILGFVIVFGFAALFAFGIEKWKERDVCVPVLRKVRGPGPIKRLLCWFFGGLADGIISVVEFFVQYIKASKQNYCPAIEWED